MPYSHSEMIERRLESELPLPPGDADVEAIRCRLARRRRRRQVVSSVSLVATATLIAFAVFRWDRPRSEIAETANDSFVPVEVILADKAADVRRGDAIGESILDDDDDDDGRDDPVVATEEQLSGSELQIYAQVRDPLPVFGVRDDTQQFVHIGWIESERTVPVDLGAFSSSQQAGIRAAFDRQTENTIQL